MTLALMTLVVGLLNLCLGFGLAVRLGLGPPGLRAAWEVVLGGRPSPATRHDAAVADALPRATPPTAPSTPSLEELLDEPREDWQGDPREGDSGKRDEGRVLE